MLVISKYLLSRTVCMILSEVFGYKGQSLPATACPRPIPGFLKTDLEGGKAYQDLEQPDTPSLQWPNTGDIQHLIFVLKTKALHVLLFFSFTVPGRLDKVRKE